MGQKINPVGFRVGVIRNWDATWFGEKEQYRNQLQEDLKLRNYIDRNLKDALINRVSIERPTNNKVEVIIFTSRPGIVIGKGGSEIDKLKKNLAKIVSTKDSKKSIFINVIEVKKPDLDAILVGRQIANDLERRVAFRRAMRGAIQRSMRAGAKGIKVMVSGRLNGVDIARVEQYTEGTVPLHTLRADIDYSWQEAKTSYGNLGIKTWIYRGDILPGDKTIDEKLVESSEKANNRSNKQRSSRRPNTDNKK